MPTYKRFEDLPIWQSARVLAEKIKRLTETELFSKDYRFVSQINDSAGSAMDNIAEGFERGSQFEFVNHLTYAKGSTGETRSQLYRSIDYRYVQKKTVEPLIAEYENLAAHIANFISYLNKSEIRGKKFEGRTK